MSGGMKTQIGKRFEKEDRIAERQYGGASERTLIEEAREERKLLQKQMKFEEKQEKKEAAK